MINTDKYEGLIDAEGYIDYDGLDHLLAEVKRLRKKIQLLHDTWFADAEMAGDVDERMNELLKYDGDEKFTKPLMPRREFLLTVEEMIE
tara:strand:- start:322 stop:588 length:267 start_codon:yes stop_codon:yes gene_type:complete